MGRIKHEERYRTTDLTAGGGRIVSWPWITKALRLVQRAGLKGMAGWLESLGLTPGTPWAIAASISEFGGGVLTTLGFLHPLGPLGTIGAMIMATVKAHWGKPIWANKGGAELPVINMATALALTLTGPGRFSLDYVLGIRLPRALVIAIAIVEAAMLAIGIVSRPTPPPPPPVEQQTTTSVEAGRGTATS